MKTSEVKCYEFSFPRLDTLILVENWNDRVVVRATRDTFSDEKKNCFVRELAAEGFISDDYLWISSGSHFSQGPLNWLVDYSWLKLDQQMIAKTRRFVVHLLAGGVLLWLILMFALFYGADHEGRGGLSSNQPQANLSFTHG